MRALIAALLLAATQFAQAAEPIGRIFFTPEQRDQLNSLRTQRIVATQVRDEPIPEVVTYNGIVRRSGGKATVWVNGEALSEAGLRDKQSIVGRVGRNGQILLQTPQAGTGQGQVRLKVGQSAELLSGRVDESFSSQAASQAVKAKSKAEMKPPEMSLTETVPVPAARQPASERASDELVRPAAGETAPFRERPGDATAK